MKIVFFTENFYEGGMDTFIVSLLNNWSDKNDQLVLVCNDNHPGKKRYQKELDKNIKQVYHSLFLTQTFRKNAKRKYKNKFFRIFLPKYISLFLSYSHIIEFYYIFAINRIFKSINPDVLFVVNGAYPGGVTCRAANLSFAIFHPNKKAFHNFHSFTNPYAVYSFFDKQVDMLLERKVASFISVSRICTNSLKTRSPFVNSKKLNFIYNGTTFNKINLGTKTDFYNNFTNLNNQKFCIMLGTYEERKGHFFLIEVIKKVLLKVPNVVLVFSGYGNESEKLKVSKLINYSNLKEKVLMLDFIRDIESLYASADLVLIGSQSFESFGLTAIEAMARKKPVVSTNTGGLTEVIKNGEGGYCFEPDDINGFAAKTVELLNNEALYYEQAEKGYNRFLQHFTIQRMVTQYEDLIKS